MKPEIPLSSRMNDNRPKNQMGGCLKIIGLIIVLMIILPYVVQFGYCRGWWLKSNLWAYYGWLCNCGHEFEQSLYPDNVEIVISACSDPQEATLSPNGRYMIVGVRLAGKSYLLDFVTDEKRAWLYPFVSRTDVEFWTDRFVRVRDINQEKKILIDVIDGSLINLTTFSTTEKDKQLIIPAEALQGFEKADKVVVQDGLINVVMALDSDPKKKSGQELRFILSGALSEAIRSYAISRWDKL